MRKGDRVRVKRTGEIGMVVWVGVSNVGHAQYEVKLAGGIGMFWEYQLEAVGWRDVPMGN